MKAAIYINEETTQVVLTAENDWERNALKFLDTNGAELHTYWGNFYGCQGGWYRQPDYSSKESLIFRIDKRMETPQDVITAQDFV